MNITIIVPYEGAATHTPIWANEENEIDFWREPERASRCTTAFAATELKFFLERTLLDAVVAFSTHRPPRSFFIELQVSEDSGSLRTGEFILASNPEGIMITGGDRASLLYGAYELLRLQGWRWYAPGKRGEISPPRTDKLTLPDQTYHFKPSFSLGRGFDFEYASMESAELWLWMARNGLNVCATRPMTGALARKLGMRPKIGGHIFEAILDPDRPMPSGRTLWEEHPNWYGLPADGERRKETALATQFCVSQPELIEFLATQFLQRLTGLWRDAESVDVWGFDTWGSTCQCSDCRALGNNADQTLFFLSHLRAHLNEARREGQFDHDVRLSTCAYEGTATLAGPQNPIPQNLIDANDCVAFYPINRCYAHDLADFNCSTNVAYQTAMASWLTGEQRLPFVAADYYNVSKYEDLPLLFTGRIRNDLPSYHTQGARGITYMHVPLVNWAMRTLTQALYAQLAWDVHTDVDAFLGEYYENWYGPYARDMRHAYDMIEEAWRLIADWRAWARTSILSQLLAWDGNRPAHPLGSTTHFETPAAAIASGRRSVALLRKAMAIIVICQAAEKRATLQGDLADLIVNVNPIQSRALEQSNQYEWRLGEDRRLLRYGIGVMSLMTEFVAYHDALRIDDSLAADTAFKVIEQTADELDELFVPIGYEWPGPGLDSTDGLTRSQLRDVVRRCRGKRANPSTRAPHGS